VPESAEIASTALNPAAAFFSCSSFIIHYREEMFDIPSRFLLARSNYLLD
jgi:hypothetical protein